MSHPLLADLIEQEFVPCVINNRGDRGSLGENDATLKLFGEPMLNNPVVRFLNSAGEVNSTQVSLQKSCARLHCSALWQFMLRPQQPAARERAHSYLVDVVFLQNIAPRLENQWTPVAVFRGIHAALSAAGRPLPKWAESMAVPSAVSTAIFTMG